MAINKIIKRVIIFWGIVFAFFLKAGFALALEAIYPSVLGKSLSDTSSIGDYVCYLFSLGTSLAVSLAVLAVATGGVYYLISYSRGKFTSEAKEWIKSGILGLLIILCSSLIIYTINPNLASCKIGKLPKVDLNPTDLSSSSSGSVDVVNYQEIPIGTLTETLLTRKMDCYGFDQEGDPVNGNSIKTDTSCTKDSNCSSGGGKCDTDAGKCVVFLPTYVSHDRADCLTQLVDGAQKKANEIAALSDKITRLMNTCSCVGKCDPVCDPATGCNPTGCPGGGCAGSCKPNGTATSGACKEPPAAKDCCPPGVKDTIEHGPIKMTIDVGAVGGSPSTPTNNNQGLTSAGIIQLGSDGLPVYNNNANTNNFENWAPSAQAAWMAGQANQALGDDTTGCRTESAVYNGLDEFRCPNPKDTKSDKTPCSEIAKFVEKSVQLDRDSQAKFGKDQIVIIDKEKWNQINLVQQLTYFKEKIDELNQNIQKDIGILDQANA